MTIQHPWGAAKGPLAPLSISQERDSTHCRIKELLDCDYGKPTQFVAENDEPALNDLNLEELRASMLADFERVFPEYRLVPAEQLKVIPAPEETVCDTAEACEENLG